MIRFLKEVYLTGFTLVYRFRPSQKRSYRAGTASGVVTFFECIILLGVLFCAEAVLRKEIVPKLSKPMVLIVVSALFVANLHFLFIRGHGIKFDQEFDRMEKSKRNRLKLSCGIIAAAAVVFFIVSGAAYRRIFVNHT